MGKILWLASYPKSGNTWLRLFLYAYFKLDPLKDEAVDLNDQGLRYFSTQDVNRAWFDTLFPEGTEDITPEMAAAVRRKAHQRIADATPGMAFVKTHNTFEVDRGSHNVTPEATAGALYIVRNPLDVAVSVKNHFGHRTMGRAIDQLNTKNWRLKQDALRVSNLIGSWSQNVESWIGQQRRGIFPVRYEDMLETPEKVFGWIIGVLGHEVDEARLRWAIDITSFDKLKRREEASGFAEQSTKAETFFRRGVAGDWREALTTGQVKQIVEKNHEMMRRFGYLDERLERFVPKPKKKR
ncbi:MAG: sulfotransferase domain-containing protein [Pseudomonadota bacterium]